MMMIQPACCLLKRVESACNSRAVAQFDSSRKRVLGDFLASYELSPGTVVHAGYGALFGRGLEEPELDRYTATARALFFKASYLLHF
jgi:hypothetical protein